MTGRGFGVGFIGYAWMGRAHAHALHTINHIAPFEGPVRLVAVAGRNEGPLAAAARELGFPKHTTRWQEVVEDPEVDIVANLAPTDAHAAPCLAALELGKPVLCEKPLGRDAPEARQMTVAADASGTTNACGFNYRFVPAVRLARELVTSGRLGEVRHFRAAYLQDWAASETVPRTWRFRRMGTANGAVGDYTHIIDLCRYLAGEVESLTAETARLVDERPDPARPGRVLKVEVEDWYAAVLRLASGATATLEASRCATGRKGRQFVEVNGSEGSLWWDMEDLNRLHLFLSSDEASGAGGFRDVLVTQPDHPFLDRWWAPGHILGWEHTFVHEWGEFLEACRADAPVGEHQASFEDGYRAAVVCDAVLESARTGRRVSVTPAESRMHVG